MTDFFLPYFRRFSTALLASSAIAMTATAQDLPDISPDQIADDVERRYDARTGETEFIAASFDPFEAEIDLAGSASLRSVTDAITIDGDIVRGGALLDISTVYTTASPDSFDVRGFEQVEFMSGHPAGIISYDSQTLDCSRSTDSVTYDDSYYRGASYGYIAGLYRIFPRYRGHRNFGWHRNSWRTGNWNRGTWRRHYRDRHGDSDWRRRRGDRDGDDVRRRRRGHDESDVTRRRHGENDGDGVRRRRGSDDGDVVRRRRNGDDGDARRRHSGNDGDGVRRRRGGDDGDTVRRRRHGDTGGTDRRRDRTGDTPQPRRRTTRTDNTPKDNPIVYRRSPNIEAATGRTDRGTRRDRPRRSQETRSRRQVTSTPKPRRAAPPVSRPQPTRQVNPTPTRAPKPRAATPPKISKPVSKPVSRPKPARINRAVDQAFKNRNPRSDNIRTQHRYYPASGYTRTDVYVSYRCVKEETLSVHIPQERLDAARFDGLAVILVDNAGRDVPVFVPPNYIEGFQKAVGYGPTGRRSSVTYRHAEPVPRRSNEPIIYGDPGYPQ